MSTALVKEQDLLIPGALVVQPKFGNDAVLERMVGSGFLPRLQLMTSTNRPVQKGQTKMGSFCLIKGKDGLSHDYGDSFSCLIITWRPKAMRFTGGNAKVFYNPAKQGFRDVESEAEKRTKGYMYGPEYLIYLPDVDQIASFHFNNLTLRMRAGEMKALLGKAGTFKSEIIEKNGNLWPAPIISLCENLQGVPEIGTDEATEFHSRLNEQVQKFANPPDEEVEEVDEAESAVASGDDRSR